MKLQFLGTGTSTGVPQLRCHCPACTSTDPCDKRLRCSALLTTDSGRNILIDCGPDIRTQLLRCGSPDIDAVLLTHSHYDHVGGIDDMRPYCYPGPLPVYCTSDVERDLRQRVPYCFAEHPYPGVPQLELRHVDPYEPFEAAEVEVEPVTVMHWKLPILGFRIGGLGYVTDCKTMPERTKSILRGLDTLVINALRHDEHVSHLNLRQALDLISELKPRRALLTHISHDMGPQAFVHLPAGVEFAHDGLTVAIHSS